MLTITVGRPPEGIFFRQATKFTSILMLMPNELVAWFDDWYIAESRQFLSVYNDTLLNYIGEAIELGKIDCTSVNIEVGHDVFVYDSHGAIVGNWPYGIFNWTAPLPNDGMTSIDRPVSNR